MMKTRSVRELRELLYWADDNGLTNDEKEALEVEMLLAEKIECGEITIEEEATDNRSFENKFWHLAPKVNGTTYLTTKAKAFRSWAKNLNEEDQQYILDNFDTIYKKNTAETFRLKRMVK